MKTLIALECLNCECLTFRLWADDNGEIMLVRCTSCDSELPTFSDVEDGTP